MRRKFIPLAAVLVLALATFILLELGIRVLPYLVRDPLKSRISEAARIPLSNTRVFGGLKGGVARLLPPAEPADILVLGDSIPFGTYVREKDTFPSLIADHQKKKVINLGVGSQSPPAYNRMLEVGLRYHPKLALYCIFANDFAYEDDIPARDLSAANERATLDGDEWLFVENLTTRERTIAALKRLTNLSLLYQFRKIYQQPATHMQVIPWQRGNVSYYFAGRDFWDPMLDWHQPRVLKSIERNHQYALKAQAFAQAQGIQLQVVFFPSKEIVYGPLAGETGEKAYSPFHYETYLRLQAELTRENISWVDLTPALREKAAENIPLFHTIDGHYNEAGHETLARLLEARL